MRQLSGSDAFFLYADKSGKHQHFSMIYLYDPSTAPGGKVDFQTVLEHVRQRIGTSRMFRQRLVEVPLDIDYPYWVHDSHFDLEFHVRHIALPHPGDWRQFCILVSRLHARRLDLSRPVWEMYVIDGLDNISFLPEDSFAILVKVHQAALDDITEDDFTVALHDLEVQPEPEELKRRWFSEPEPGTTQLLALAWFNNTIKLLEMGQQLLGRLPLLGGMPLDAESVLHFDEEDAPETRFDAPISPHRVWAPFTFYESDVAKIKAAIADASLDDIAIAICSGGLRHYLAEKKELPEKSLYALLPLHVHHEDAEGLPGHRVQLIRVRLMTNVADPLERLAAIREETAEAQALKPLSGEELEELQDVLPATAMTLAAKTIAARLGPGRRYRQNHNTVITINPGPTRQLYLCGARLVGFTGMAALMDHLGLHHTVTNYEGNVTIAPVCDRRMMPDPAFYYECLRAAHHELLAAARAAVSRAGEAQAESVELV